MYKQEQSCEQCYQYFTNSQYKLYIITGMGENRTERHFRASLKPSMNIKRLSTESPVKCNNDAWTKYGNNYTSSMSFSFNAAWSAIQEWTKAEEKILTLKVLIATTDAQWEGMGDVGSARYELALLPPCPTIRVLRYSN